MPIYEYRCSSCGHQQEFLQKVSDTPLTVCPQCGKPTFSKMLTRGGLPAEGQRLVRDRLPQQRREARGERSSDVEARIEVRDRSEARDRGEARDRSEARDAEHEAALRPRQRGLKR